MELTKEQSFEIIAHNAHKNYFKNKFKFTSKTKEICLGCAKPIYVSFKHISVNNIFCSFCRYSYMTTRTIVQYKYMNYVKNKQLRLTQQLLNAENPKFSKEVIRPILIKSEDTVNKYNIEPVSRIKNKTDNDMDLDISPYLENALNDFTI